MMKLKKLKIPTENDWNTLEHDKPRDQVASLDRQHAKLNFLGKSFTDAFDMFDENIGKYMTHFWDMPRACFKYYYLALIAYLRNVPENYVYDDTDYPKDYACASDTVFSTLEYRLQHYPDGLGNVLYEDGVMDDLEYIANNQTLYDADIDIFDNYKDRLSKIKKTCDEKGIKY
ncbi:MAG: hypothetical protein ACTHOO_01005 [Alcanivorax sp.]